MYREYLLSTFTVSYAFFQFRDCSEIEKMGHWNCFTFLFKKIEKHWMLCAASFHKTTISKVFQIYKLISCNNHNVTRYRKKYLGSWNYEKPSRLSTVCSSKLRPSGHTLDLSSFMIELTKFKSRLTGNNLFSLIRYLWIMSKRMFSS